MPSGYSYQVSPTANPLSKEQLYAGRTVCYSDLTTNPNNVGILEDSRNVPGAKGVWTAVINGVREYFSIIGAKIENNNVGTTSVLYGVLSDGDVDPTVHNSKTRGSTVPGESNTVSVTYMLPKDYFAAEAINALIMKHPAPLSMDDGTIALLAAKAYKIAAAMAKEAYGSRENDPSSSQSGDYVNVNPSELQTNSERILYNINESIKAKTNSDVTTGIIVSNLTDIGGGTNPLAVNIANTPDVHVTNTPSVSVSNTPSVNVNGTVPVSGTVSVSNMPSQPIDVNVVTP